MAITTLKGSYIVEYTCIVEWIVNTIKVGRLHVGMALTYP